MARRSSHLSLVPISLAEANTLLFTLGDKERQLATIVAGLEASIAKLREAANVAAAPLEVEIKRLTGSLQVYATAHRETLVPAGKKSFVLPAGEIGWRTTPGKVTFGRGGEEKAKETILKLGLSEYLREVVTVDKEALLKDRPKITGVTYAKTEQFYVKPESEKAPETFPGSAAARS